MLFFFWPSGEVGYFFYLSLLLMFHTIDLTSFGVRSGWSNYHLIFQVLEGGPQTKAGATYIRMCPGVDYGNRGFVNRNNRKRIGFVRGTVPISLPPFCISWGARTKGKREPKVLECLCIYLNWVPSQLFSVLELRFGMIVRQI